ncbi:MAG: ABC transporter permease [Holophagales bacterium]|nr:ABC transporter permease [Holophagales bacterium]MYG32111.1 ABC transporter permease [Holophagales bacterium]MYI80821.1 ABC transporter permease [Holophagales bacterium]
MLTVAALTGVMSLVSEPFASADNLFNVSRNFAFIGLIALGQTAVIATGGIDLSVGSVMGLAGIVTGLVLGSGQPLALAAAAGLGCALLCGLVNGALVGYLRLSPFVVTLGMLSIARSLALVVSNNRMIHDFGPDEDLVLALGGGRFLGLANPVWLLLVAALGTAAWFRYSRLARHVLAVGGNEVSTRLAGVPVARVKLTVYVLSSLLAGASAILMIGWLGAVTNALGQGYELRVIASAVIGGANLMGGEGGAFGAVAGAALIELIRNSLLLLGVDPYWQGAFVGGSIIVAMLVERVRRGRQTAG